MGTAAKVLLLGGSLRGGDLSGALLCGGFLSVNRPLPTDRRHRIVVVDGGHRACDRQTDAAFGGAQRLLKRLKAPSVSRYYINRRSAEN